MMRSALVVAVAIAGCGKATEPSVCISIGADTLRTAQLVAAGDLLACLGAVVAVRRHFV